MKAVFYPRGRGARPQQPTEPPAAARRAALRELTRWKVWSPRGLQKWFSTAWSSTTSASTSSAARSSGLLGPNGAGKTTSFYMIVGLLPTGRRPHLPGGPGDHRAAHVPALPAGHGLPAAGVVGVPQADRRGEPARDPRDARPRARRSARARARGAARRARPDRAGARTRPTRCRAASGGGWRSRGRSSPARSYLLLDEPFTGIDPIAIGDIQEIVARLRERGIGILITDHNVRETLAITDRAYILYDGKILVSGTASEIANNPIAREIYLGREVLPLGRTERRSHGHGSAPLTTAEPAGRHDPAAAAGHPAPAALHARAAGGRAEGAARESAPGGGGRPRPETEPGRPPRPTDARRAGRRRRWSRPRWRRRRPTSGRPTTCPSTSPR